MLYHISKRHPINNGFTLIEGVIVLSLLGIIAIVAINKILLFSKVPSEVEILKSNLRFVQFKAMNDDIEANNNSWGIVFSNNGYSLICGNSCSTTPNFPNENSSTHNCSDGVTISPNLTITFDRWGSPYINNTSQATTISISDNSSSQTISVTKNTGFIP